jgi:adenosine deaminase
MAACLRVLTPSLRRTDGTWPSTVFSDGNSCATISELRWTARIGCLITAARSSESSYSSEVGYPPELFADVFAAAAQAGRHRVAHAGEEGPPSYIWQALDVLGAERIDHGVRCLEDPALVRRLAADQIPLTVCPLSNLGLQVARSWAEVPVARMLDAGLLVTINSDDPAYFGGYVDDDFQALARELSLSSERLEQLAANSFHASFLPEERRLAYLAQLAAHAQEGATT